MPDINDPKLWRSFDWDEYDEERSVEIKSQQKVEAARRNKLQALNPEWQERQKAGVKKAWDSESGAKRKETLGKKISKFRKENPRETTEEERTQRSEIAKNLHQDPEFRKKYEEAISNRNYHTERAIEGRQKAAEKRRKIIVTPRGEVETISAMSKLYGINIGSCQTRMKDKPHLYYYKDDGPGEPTYEDIVYTPDGRFKSRREAMKAYTGNLPKNQGWWKKVNTLYPDKYYITSEIKEDYE